LFDASTPTFDVFIKLPPSKARPPTSTNIVRSVTTPCHMQAKPESVSGVSGVSGEKQEDLEARLLVSTL